MSFITLVFIEGNTLSILHDHYEHVLNFLNNPKEKPCFDLDAGYLIANNNTKTIFSNQSAFHKHHLKEWKWVDV